MNWHLINADARSIPLADESIHCGVTSPPYFALRDYGVAGQIGLESSLEDYIAAMVGVFREVRRVLRPDGTLWLNIGDSWASGKGSCNNPGGGANSLSGHAELKDAGAYKLHRGNVSDLRRDGLKPKDLMNVPHRLVLALQADGWWHRDTIIWAKPNPMPSSVTDRTTPAHEYIFLLTKSARYFYDPEAIRVPLKESSIGRLKQSTFDQQKGGPKDYGIRTNANRSARKALCNLKEKLVAHEKWGDRYAGWEARDKSIGANKRSVWTVSTEPCKAAHFATYPQKLITPCILAGTSAKGCCPTCGAPWKRVVEKVRMATRPGLAGKMTDKSLQADENMMATAKLNRDPQRHVSQVIGETWTPSCKCGHTETVPCKVFDPFAGAGTTLIVAARHGRIGYGTELNPQYIGIARERIATELAKPVKPVRKTRAPRGEPTLFPSEAA